MQASGRGSIDRQEIEAEAARLLVKHSGNPTAEDEAELCAWIDADPEHAIAYARAEICWEAAERLKSSASDVNMLPPALNLSEAPQGRRLTLKIAVGIAVAVMIFAVAALAIASTIDEAGYQDAAAGSVPNA